jgi:rare lipoprotein A (peptidoglycan hydrolase)
LDTKATVILTYNDRGPAEWTGNTIDLTPAAFEALGGKLKDGKMRVKVKAI